MSKIKLGVIFGGMSTEHDVSVVSATSIIQNLNKKKYEIFPIYISKDGKWYNYVKKIDDIKTLKIGEKIEEIEQIENEFKLLKNLDVAFPVLHGLYGEDGTIQGMLELLKVKYVGCKVLASSICMDKVYAKIIFEKAKIPQAKYVYVRKCNNENNICKQKIAEKNMHEKNGLSENEEIYKIIDEEFNEQILNLQEISQKVKEKLGFPVFVKPSNSGSSVGINKAKNETELEEAIRFAAKYDTKILIEEEIVGREVECAVIGNEDVKATLVGEILPAEEFYTFDAKYKKAESRVVIPAEISKEKHEEIAKIAVKAFKAVDGKGLSRVDFFIKENGEIYLNEINTLPGFTQISMYPKLWENMGLSYNKLLDKLIELAT